MASPLPGSAPAPGIRLQVADSGHVWIHVPDVKDIKPARIEDRVSDTTAWRPARKGEHVDPRWYLISKVPGGRLALIMPGLACSLKVPTKPTEVSVLATYELSGCAVPKSLLADFGKMAATLGKSPLKGGLPCASPNDSLGLWGDSLALRKAREQVFRLRIPGVVFLMHPFPGASYSMDSLLAKGEGFEVRSGERFQRLELSLLDADGKATIIAVFDSPGDHQRIPPSKANWIAGKDYQVRFFDQHNAPMTTVSFHVLSAEEEMSMRLIRAVVAKLTFDWPGWKPEAAQAFYEGYLMLNMGCYGDVAGSLFQHWKAVRNFPEARQLVQAARNRAHLAFEAKGKVKSEK